MSDIDCIFLFKNRKELNLNKEIMALLEVIVSKIDKLLPYPFNEELKGKIIDRFSKLSIILFFLFTKII